MSKQLSLFDLAPGKVLVDRFEIVRPHRQGGMSATFEVKDATSKEVCELQVLPAALFEGVDQASEFGEGMARWSEVESKRVLHVRDVVSMEDGTTLFVTDFPPGRSLRHWLNENARMDAGRVRSVCLQLLEGLEEIHAAGLVHGDIKPYTIHIDESDKAGEELEAVLVDGGITTGLWNAKHLGEQTALIGTPFYAPVEQFGGDSPNVQTDIYNVATVFFELLTGVLPWAGSSFLEVFQAKLDKATPSMSARAPDVEVAPEFDRAIVGGLMADRNERYASAEEFRLRIEAIPASAASNGA